MLSNAQHTVITVTNWDSYQDQPAKQPTGNQPVTNEQPTDNQRVTTNKNDKNVNNDKNEKNNNGEFDLVWSMYEKKGNKKTSQERFNKMTDANKQLMAKHLPEYVKTTPDLQYRKNLEVYINKECWNDEILSKPKASEFSAITQKNIQNLQGEW